MIGLDDILPLSVNLIIQNFNASLPLFWWMQVVWQNSARSHSWPQCLLHYLGERFNKKTQTSYDLEEILCAFLCRFIFLGESFTTLQYVGAVITVVAIYLVNYKEADQKTWEDEM